jgi:hypothetical protein
VEGKTSLRLLGTIEKKELIGVMLVNFVFSLLTLCVCTFVGIWNFFIKKKGCITVFFSRCLFRRRIWQSLIVDVNIHFWIVGIGLSSIVDSGVEHK